MMKKLLLVAAFTFFGLSSAFSQGIFKLGVDAGLPTGDVSDFSDFKMGADIAYMMDLAGVAQVGPLVGYSHFFIDDEIADEDLQFIPVAASGRFTLLPAIFVGADLGYAIGVNEGNDGGFYYRPQVGYNFFAFNLVLSYSGVALDGMTASAVNLGVELSL